MGDGSDRPLGETASEKDFEQGRAREAGQEKKAQ